MKVHKDYFWIVIDKWNYRQASRKHKLKSRWDKISYPLEWLKLNRLATSNVGEDMEQLDISYNAGQNSSILRIWIFFFMKLNIHLA